MRVWDVAAVRAIHTLEGHTRYGFRRHVRAGRAACFWQLRRHHASLGRAEGELVQTLKRPEARARGLALSPDGKLLVTSSITPPFPVWRWDVRQTRTARGSKNGLLSWPATTGPPLSPRSAPTISSSPAPARTARGHLRCRHRANQGIAGPIGDGGDRAWAVAFHPRDAGRLAAGYSKTRS